MMDKRSSVTRDDLGRNISRDGDGDNIEVTFLSSTWLRDSWSAWNDAYFTASLGLAELSGVWNIAVEMDC